MSPFMECTLRSTPCEVVSEWSRIGRESVWQRRGAPLVEIVRHGVPATFDVGPAPVPASQTAF